MTALKKVTRISLKRDPEAGERGAMPRMRKFAVGVKYMSGAAGEQFKDYVMYNGAWYGCVVTHTPTSTNPYDDSSRWEVETSFAFLATECIIIGSDGQGWILSEGRITHSLGKVTLNSDGSANFNDKCKISSEGILESIGAIIRSLAGDREIRIDNFGISGMTGDELDFILSNEKATDLDVLCDGGTSSAKTIVCNGFSPKFTDDNMAGYDSDAVENYWIWNDVCFGSYFLGYMEAGATLKMTATPALRWVYPGWTLQEYMDEADIACLYDAYWVLEGLSVYLYKDGENIGQLAYSSIQGFTGKTGLATSSWNSTNLTVKSAGVAINESGMYSIKIVADTVKMSIDAQTYDYEGDNDQNVLVNGYSYPAEDAEWMKSLYFLMQLANVKLNISASPFEGVAVFKDALAVIMKEASMLFDTNMFRVLHGDYGLKVSSSGIQKSTDGGTTWTSL